MMNILKYLTLKQRYNIRFTSKQIFRLVNRLKDDFNEENEMLLFRERDCNAYCMISALECSQMKFIESIIKDDRSNTTMYRCCYCHFITISKHFKEIINILNEYQFYTYMYVIGEIIFFNNYKFTEENFKVIENKFLSFNEEEQKHLTHKYDYFKQKLNL